MRACASSQNLSVRITPEASWVRTVSSLQGGAPARNGWEMATVAESNHRHKGGKYCSDVMLMRKDFS